MSVQELSPDLLRQNIPAVMLGSSFVFVGVASCSVAAIRRRAQARILVWFGLFIGLYGCRMLAEQAAVLHLSSKSGWTSGVVTEVNFLLVIPALLFWFDLSLGWLKRLILWLVAAGSLVAIAGFTCLAAGVPLVMFLRLNLIIAVGSMLVMSTVLAIPRLANRQLALQTGILKFVMPAIAIMTVVLNCLWLINVPPPAYVEPVVLVVWIFSLGYEAASRTFVNERRLVAIETELETARRLQASILPSRVPEVAGLCITATYKPMSAVAGDFYHFLPLDEHRVGVLVADVTGHGVPAALIASMIKIAAQSVASVASDPSLVLGRLNAILTPELGGSLTSAAYLLVDAKTGSASFSAAGHPPLLHWVSARSALMRTESNGLIFGVNPSCDYPARVFGIASGDRLLLYTDGLVEPENASGEPFGDRRLEQVVLAHNRAPGAVLAKEILSGLSSWQSVTKSQQDDITLLTIDVC